MELVYGISTFTLVVFLLSVFVLVVRHRVLPRETVTLTINETWQRPVQTGEKLLSVLSEQGIYLPAACGGRGSCGQCRVQLLGDSGPLLPTEAAHIRHREAAAGFRLACMVAVREAMSLRLPEDILGARRWTGRVLSNRQLTPLLTELTVAVEDSQAFRYQAGDYLLLEAPAGEVQLRDVPVASEFAGDWQQLGIADMRVRLTETTRRAYSLASYPGEDHLARFVVRLALPPAAAPRGAPPGRVSSYLFTLRPEQTISLAGPFGNFHVRDNEREMIFIGGGAGIAPMRAMILDQLKRVQSRRRMSFWYGARSVRDLCYQRLFDELAREHDNFSYQVALSESRAGDGWTGLTGFIHRCVYEQYLKDHPEPEAVDYYLCGPPLLASAVTAMLEDLGVDENTIFFDDFGS